MCNLFYCLAHQPHVAKVYVASSDTVYFNLRTSDLGHCKSPSYINYTCEFQSDIHHTLSRCNCYKNYFHDTNNIITVTQLSCSESRYAVLHVMRINITCDRFSSHPQPNSANLNYSINFEGVLTACSYHKKLAFNIIM
jgi:hypothetical protein